MKNPLPLAVMLADGLQACVQKMQRRKSRIELCDVMNVCDEFGRSMKVYYRVIDAPHSAQSDASGDSYTIEQVLYKGRKVALTGKGEQELLLHLNLVNPKGVRFQYR